MTLNDQYIIVDGKLLPIDAPVLTASNRAFGYGDGLFETIHAYGTELQMADEHFDRMYKGMKTLKMEWDESLTQIRLTKEISHLLNRTKLFKGTRVRITVYRQTGGLYKPLNNNISYLIEPKALEIDFYKLNDKGLHIGIFDEIKKPVDSLSAYKTCNSLINVLAGLNAQNSGWDDSLICNQAGQIIEGYHSNLFLLKNGTLFTPSIEVGCVAGIMRGKILKLATELGIKVNDKIQITENILLEADEIFLTNAIEGIRWVMAFKSRRYFNLFARKLNEALNKSVFGKLV